MGLTKRYVLSRFSRKMRCDLVKGQMANQSGAIVGFRKTQQGVQDLVRHQPREQGTCAPRMELGQGGVHESRVILQRPEPTSVRDPLLRNLQHEPCGKERSRRRV